MILDKEKFRNYHCDQYKFNDEEEGIRTLSLEELMETVGLMIRNAKLNNKELSEVPVFIESDGKHYCIGNHSISCGKTGMACTFGTKFQGTHNEKLYYLAPDKKPVNGEYFEVRGISDGLDLSGFLVSKRAGERLLRLVKYVLDTDEPESWLDYREGEPDWIQFKFKPSEFDLELLDKLTKDADGVVTYDILKQCKKQK